MILDPFGFEPSTCKCPIYVLVRVSRSWSDGTFTSASISSVAPVTGAYVWSVEIVTRSVAITLVRTFVDIWENKKNRFHESYIAECKDVAKLLKKVQVEINQIQKTGINFGIKRVHKGQKADWWFERKLIRSDEGPTLETSSSPVI